jgi:membrane protease YdiL (CAAX protease family)
LLFKPHHSNGSLIALGVTEVLVGTVLCLFLWARGWTLTRIGLKPTLTETGIGLGLGVLSYFAYVVAFIVFAMLFPGLASQARDMNVLPAGGVPLAIALIIPWINGFYEELFVAGYIITALRETRSVQVAINVSVLIRLSYHLYQGPFGVIAVIPLGLILGYWYARNGKLWPLVAAHAAIDLVAFLSRVQV